MLACSPRKWSLYEVDDVGADPRDIVAQNPRWSHGGPDFGCGGEDG